MARFASLLAAAFAGALAASPLPAQTPGKYTEVAIVQPAHEATVHDNQGNVAVQVAVSPSLAPRDRIVVLLDGRPAARQAGTAVALSGVERGEHTLQALVVDANGATLATSQPVTFYMWQASRLFPSRKGK